MGENDSLSWAMYQDVLIVAQIEGLPTSSDWAEYMNDLRALRFKGVLVAGHGNKLTALQRADVERLLKANGARLAVVTGSAVTRGVMIALGWMGLPVKAFAPTNLEGALEFLAVDPEQRQEGVAAVEALHRSLRQRHARASAHG